MIAGFPLLDCDLCGSGLRGADPMIGTPKGVTSVRTAVAHTGIQGPHESMSTKLHHDHCALHYLCVAVPRQARVQTDEKG